MVGSLKNGSEKLMVHSQGGIAFSGVFFGLTISKELVFVDLCVIVKSTLEDNLCTSKCHEPQVLFVMGIRH